MCNNCNGGSEGCVADVVKFIDILQKQVKPCPKHEGCDKPRLGTRPPSTRKFNTRPFILYMQAGQLFEAQYGTDPEDTSPYLRVEEVECGCCKCRVLKPVCESPGTRGGKRRLKGTDYFVTIDLGCCCAIQCMEDTFIKC